jgi:hypothetical protein
MNNDYERFNKYVLDMCIRKVIQKKNRTKHAGFAPVASTSGLWWLLDKSRG